MSLDDAGFGLMRNSNSSGDDMPVGGTVYGARKKGLVESMRRHGLLDMRGSCHLIKHHFGGIYLQSSIELPRHFRRYM